MPLLSVRRPFPSASLGIWQIKESEDFFRQGLPLSEAEAAELSLHKGIRRSEWLAGRWLLHQLSGHAQRLPLAKDAFSKPFFVETPDLQCSMSHSHGTVAALLFEGNALVGCDLQVLVPKMTRLAHKFVNTDEYTFLQQFSPEKQFDLLHIFWTAKEAMYKAYGLKALDFKRDIHIMPFVWDGLSARVKGAVTRADIYLKFDLLTEKNALPEAGDFICTTAVQTI